MEVLQVIAISSQMLFTMFGVMYFCNAIKQQKAAKQALVIDTKAETEKLKKLREIRLNRPLSEKARPKHFSDIVGQERGVRALMAALCGPNPQHVIIYGQPGVGKTAAARLVLEAAKASPKSPFAENAPFVEVDATVLQFDERSIADPLIGSVHDPIYQGAGAFGQAGIPQPKPGAVTKAHGGVLFIDEIGELHPTQMNRLLKVLEDGRVLFQSTYYSPDNPLIPNHIHDIFMHGAPADFRLVGATTRRPESLPDALRSRCTEIFFKGLSDAEVRKIGERACVRAGFTYDPDVPPLLSLYARNGRDAVNLVQMASSLAILDEREHIYGTDIEEMAEHGHFSPHIIPKVSREAKIGVVNGLAVAGSQGVLLEIEATAVPAEQKAGTLRVTGIVEEEEIRSQSGRMRRTGTAKNAVTNMLTLMEKVTGIRANQFDIHVNFPGGMPVDGPSAGIALFTAVYSALYNKRVPAGIAMTGEISIKGKVCPVGGVPEKVEAAVAAGARKVLVPKSNAQASLGKYDAELVYLEDVNDLLAAVFGEAAGGKPVVIQLEPGQGLAGTL